MDYLITKKQVLELKLEHVKLLMEKKEIIRRQQYEAAAEARERERHIISALEAHKTTLLQRIEELKLIPSKL